jgi:hypothetical protein
MLQSTKLLKGKVSVGISVKRGSGGVLKFASSWLLGLQEKRVASTRKKTGISEKYFLGAIQACRFEKKLCDYPQIYEVLKIDLITADNRRQLTVYSPQHIFLPFKSYFLWLMVLKRIYTEEIYLKIEFGFYHDALFPFKKLGDEASSSLVRTPAAFGHSSFCSAAAVARSAGEPSIFTWTQGGAYLYAAAQAAGGDSAQHLGF